MTRLLSALFVEKVDSDNEFWTDHGANYRDTEVWKPRVKLKVRPTIHDWERDVRIRTIEVEGPELLDRGDYDYIGRLGFAAIRRVPILVFCGRPGLGTYVRCFESEIFSDSPVLQAISDYAGTDDFITEIRTFAIEQGVAAAELKYFGPISGYSLLEKSQDRLS